MSPREDPEMESLLHFGGFTLDRRRRGLYRGGERIHLTPKPLETLIFLVENHGRVVEKQALLDAVWTDTFVTEDNLVHAIREIRRALEDDKEDPRFVQTVHRLGYRFVAEVSSIPDGAHPKAAEGNAELHAGRQESDAVAGLPDAPAQGRYVLPLAFAALVVGAAGLWLAWRLLGPGYEPGAPAGKPVVLKQLTSGEFGAGKAAYSSDGNIVCNIRGALHVVGPGGGTPLRITDYVNPSGDMPVFTASGSDVVFSLPREGTDGSRIYDLWIVAASGGPLRLFIPEASGAGFSPDGKWVAYTKYSASRKALWISPVADLSQHREVRDRGFVPRWSPDGRWIAYSTGDPNSEPGEIWIVSVSLSEHRRLTRVPIALYGMAWTADSRWIIFAARRYGHFHLHRVAASGGPVESVLAGVGDYYSPSVSPDGRTLIFHHANVAKDLFTAEGPATPDLRRLTQDEYHMWPRLSPAGLRVASVTRRPDTDERLYVTDLRTVNRTAALSDGPARHPCWSNEEDIGFLSTDSNSVDTNVKIVHLATGVTVSATRFTGTADWLAIHPDGRTLAVVSHLPGGRQSILLRNLDRQSDPDQVLAQGGSYECLRWRPDGSMLSWSGPELSSGPESNGIWVVEPGRSKPRRIVDDGYWPVWSADGESIYYLRIREAAGLWRLNLRSAKTERIRVWSDVPYYDIVGNRLVFVQQAGRTQVYSMPLDW